MNPGLNTYQLHDHWKRYIVSQSTYLFFCIEDEHATLQKLVLQRGIG
jgi:hypothetical protein